MYVFFMYKLVNNTTSGITIDQIYLEANGGEYDLYDEKKDLGGLGLLCIRESMKDYNGLNKMIHHEEILIYHNNDSITPQEFYDLWGDKIAKKYQFSSALSYKMYKYMSKQVSHLYTDFSILPETIDFKRDITIKLVQKDTFKSGFIVKSEYFESVDVVIDPSTGLEISNYNNPITKVLFKWDIGNNGYLKQRHSRRYWQLTNDKYSEESKYLTKSYNVKKARKEGKTRRENIIDICIIEMGGIILMTEPTISTVYDAETLASPLLGYLDEDINKYIKGVRNDLITDVSNVVLGDIGIDLDFFSNLVPNTPITIREYMIMKLNEAYLTDNTSIQSDEW